LKIYLLIPKDSEAMIKDACRVSIAVCREAARRVGTRLDGVVDRAESCFPSREVKVQVERVEKRVLMVAE
jgi:hypothetical protein